MPEHCFAHLGRMGADLGREKVHLGTYDIITPYGPFSACERGWDGMDWLRSLWMMFSQSLLIEYCQYWPLGARFHHWACWARYFALKILSVGGCNIFTSFPPLSTRRGRREWMDGTPCVWMTFLFRNASALSYLIRSPSIIKYEVQSKKYIGRGHGAQANSSASSSLLCASTSCPSAPSSSSSSSSLSSSSPPAPPAGMSCSPIALESI